MLGFSEKKTTQAAAYILKKAEGNRMNYMRLLKLLYLADRKSLAIRKAPICGGTVFAMDQGPVISQVLNMIKGLDPAADAWEAHIEKMDFDVALKGAGPGAHELSPAELRILDETVAEHRDRDEWELVDWCHKNLQEYIDNEPPQGGRNPIPLGDLLRAAGKPEMESEILDLVNENLHFQRLFGHHCLSQE